MDVLSRSGRMVGSDKNDAPPQGTEQCRQRD
jgi:hypothetical protein